ncbi:MAG: isocitrate/isopropylmalate dehydrogenase family protein [Pseudomonadota bacterium]
MKERYKIVVVPGDGIGPEIIDATLSILNAAWGNDCPLDYEHHPAGAELFLETGDSFPEESFNACRGADAILHGAAGLPGVVHPDGTEAGLDFTLSLRTELDLFANVRPIHLQPGVESPLNGVDKIDYVIVRENSEGLYVARGAGVQLRSDLAVDTLVQTRKGIERVVRFAFDLARSRNGAPRDGVRRVTCCDKANVLRSYAFFRSVFDEVAQEYPDIEAEHCLVDAMTVHLVLRPDHYDVIVSENMFGDIISDLGAATVGGLGMAPSSEIGQNAGLFQASHGSAPDIAGKGLANPYATILTACGMLDWLGLRYDDQRLISKSNLVRECVATVIQSGRAVTADLGGSANTKDVEDAILAQIRSADMSDDGAHQASALSVSS